MVTEHGKVFSEEELDFERERLLNLIGSKIVRNDIDVAQNLAGDLYDVEMKFALGRKIRNLKRLNRFVFRLILLTLPVIVASMIFTILGLRPFFNLTILAAALTTTFLFILINAVVIRHFAKTRWIILNSYDIRRQTFIGRLTQWCLNYNGHQAFSTAAIKREIHQWLAIEM